MLNFPMKQTLLYLKRIHRNRPLPAIQQAQYIATSYQPMIISHTFILRIPNNNFHHSG